MDEMNKYFEKAGQAGPPQHFFSDEELLDITRNGHSSDIGHDNTPKPQSAWLRKLISTIRSNIMLTSIVSIVALLSTVMLTIGPNNSIDNSLDEQEVVSSNINNQSAIDQNTVNTNNETSADKEHNELAANHTSDANLTGAESAQYRKSSPATQQPRQWKHNDSDYLPLIKLSDEELKKIGIFRKAGGYELHSIEALSRWKEEGYIKRSKRLTDAGIDLNDPSGIFTEVYTLDTIRNQFSDNPSWKTDPALDGIIPLGLLSNNECGLGDGAICINTYRYHPGTIYEVGRAFHLELLDISDVICWSRNYFLQTADSINVMREKYTLLRQALPVYLHVGPRDRGADMTIWFQRTKEFIDALPSRYANALRDEDAMYERLMPRQEDIEEYNPDRLRQYVALFGRPENYDKWEEDTFVWDTLIYDSKQKLIEGRGFFVRQNNMLGIGPNILSYDDMKKYVYPRVYQDIQRYNPPELNILTEERDASKFDSLFKISLVKAVGNESDIAKLHIFRYVSKVCAFNLEEVPFLRLSGEELEKIGVRMYNGAYYCYRDLKINYKLEDGITYFAGMKSNAKDSVPTYDLRGIPLMDWEKNKKSATMKPSFINGYLHSFGYDTTIGDSYFRNVLVLDTTHYVDATAQYGGWDQKEFLKIQPIMMKYVKSLSISEAEIGVDVFDNSPFMGQEDLFKYFDWAFSRLHTVETKYIPVYVSTGDTNISHQVASYYILWYPLTDDFIGALPNRYREPLRKEVDLILKVENGEIPAEEACEIMKADESLLGICSMSTPTILGLKVYPNPVTDNNLKIKFHLSEKTNIRIDIHTIDGKYLDTYKSRWMEMGDHEYIINLDKFGATKRGVYQISIISTNGEHVVKRFVRV